MSWKLESFTLDSKEKRGAFVARATRKRDDGQLMDMCLQVEFQPYRRVSAIVLNLSIELEEAVQRYSDASRHEIRTRRIGFGARRRALL